MSLEATATLILDRLTHGRSKHWRELVRRGDWTRLLQIRHPEHERYRVYYERGFFERVPTMALKDFALEQAARELMAEREELKAEREELKAHRKRRADAIRRQRQRRAEKQSREGVRPTSEGWKYIGKLPGADDVLWEVWHGTDSGEWIPVKLVRVEPGRKANAWLAWSWAAERLATTKDAQIMRRMEPELIKMVEQWAASEL